MRLATFKSGGRTSYGAATGTGIVDLGRALPQYPTLLDLLRAQALGQARGAAAAAPDYALDAVEFLPPLLAPEKIICVGINYPERSTEYKDRTPPEKPKYPNLFIRFPGSLVGHEQPIVRPLCRRNMITRAKSCW